MQAADGDPLAPVCHPVEIAWSRFINLKYILTASKVSKILRLRLFQASVISTLLYGCESRKSTEKVKRKLKSAASKMLATITGRTIQEEDRNPTINVVTKAAGQKMELAGTRPTHARAPPGTPSPGNLCQTYSQDAFRRRTKSEYRNRN